MSANHLLKFDRKYKEWRTQRDHVQNRTEGFTWQMDEMVAAYLEWDFNLGDGGLGANSPPTPGQGQSGLQLQIVDVFSEYFFTVLFFD